MQTYLITQGIRGQRIELYTGKSIGQDSYIYDDSIGGDAISTNGYHTGILILIQNQEIVFDNHHPDGLERTRWLANLMFPSRLHLGQPFQIMETPF
ncbi:MULTISPECIES: papain fold toxin domain-containing protein [Leptolyngbya]|uniref:papain fold toxin domain-containing protein n=1 Tax=Leptolyngbya TaxID=47251 RepID=UPI0016834675|nr:hypothetical protein [Leptolyngbya sp. FACHB-1624]